MNPQQPTTNPAEGKRKYHDGRDEMNLADFPISALQRQQPSDADGHKRDRLEFEATRYDSVTHQRVRQRVTLTSTSRDGLPTPADEHVILALLYVAKHSHNFADATVYFAPSQMFDVMGWAPNGRSYTRLRDVLRRLKSLTIRYENAWWDAAGRGYEEEVATGVISAYKIARQVSGPRTANTTPLSWATWTQQFHQSLLNGNIKRLDLELFFRLKTPTAQRMYRFLDKRFYNTDLVAMDLIEFACGHIGLTESANVAILKRRLAAAVAELEEIGFLARLDPAERYQKVKAGVWRVQFRKAARQVEATQPALVEKPDSLAVPAAPALLAAEYYRLWDATAVASPGPRDLEQAETILREHGSETAQALIACLVRVTKKRWPDCRSLSGAVQKYLPEALRLHQLEQRREAARETTETARRQEQESLRTREQTERRLQEAWNRLPAAEREALRCGVLAKLGDATAPEAFIQRLCLEEMARKKG
jgi:plasmid replication initiation protein